MILAIFAMIAAQTATPSPAMDGLTLFRQVCVEGGRPDPQLAGSAVSFAALPSSARATLARLNNAYETLDADSGVNEAWALPGGNILLIQQTPSFKSGGTTAPSCIVLWSGGDF